LLTEHTLEATLTYANSTNTSNNKASTSTTVVQAFAVDGFDDPSNDPVTNGEWTFINGLWAREDLTESNGILRQTEGMKSPLHPRRATDYEERKAIWTAVPGSPTEVRAQVRIDQAQVGELARAGIAVFTDSLGRGYNLVFTGRHGYIDLEFLNDEVAWSNNPVYVDPATGQEWVPHIFYNFHLEYDEADRVLYGKAWQVGMAEPEDWTITYNLPVAWNRTGGHVSLNGSAAGRFEWNESYGMISFDNVWVPGLPVGSTDTSGSVTAASTGTSRNEIPILAILDAGSAAPIQEFETARVRPVADPPASVLDAARGPASQTTTERGSTSLASLLLTLEEEDDDEGSGSLTDLLIDDRLIRSLLS
jgi:hypothetical protein